MSYEITTPDGDSISMHGGENKTLRFQVTNKASRDMDTACKIICEDALDPGWCRLTPDGDQLVTAGQTKIYEVAIGVPDSVQTSSGKVTVEASWVRDPNGTFTTGPKVGLVLLPVEVGLTFWQKYGKWIAAAAVVLLVVVLSIVWFSGGVKIESFTATPPSVASGKPIEFQWTLNSEVASAVLTLSDGSSRHELTDLELRAGKVSKTIKVHGEKTATLFVYGTDDSHDHMDAKYTVQAPPQAPKIKNFTARASGPSHRGASWSTLMLSWNVAGDHTKLEAQVGKHKPIVLSKNSGTIRPRLPVKYQDRVVLTVHYRGGRAQSSLYIHKNGTGLTWPVFMKSNPKLLRGRAKAHSVNRFELTRPKPKKKR